MNHIRRSNRLGRRISPTRNAPVTAPTVGTDRRPAPIPRAVTTATGVPGGGVAEAR